MEKAKGLMKTKKKDGQANYLKCFGLTEPLPEHQLGKPCFRSPIVMRQWSSWKSKLDPKEERTKIQTRTSSYSDESLTSLTKSDVIRNTELLRINTILLDTSTPK